MNTPIPLVREPATFNRFLILLHTQGPQHQSELRRHFSDSTIHDVIKPRIREWNSILNHIWPGVCLVHTRYVSDARRNNILCYSLDPRLTLSAGPVLLIERGDVAC